MDEEDDTLHIAEYFLGRYGAATVALMDSRADACERDGDEELARLWRCVAAEVRRVERDGVDLPPTNAATVGRGAS